METVNLKLFKLKSKIKETCDNGKQKLISAARWCQENPLLASAAASVLVSGFRTVRKGVIVHSEEVSRRRRLYDPRNGRYSFMKRDPDQWESIEINRRFKAGEDYESILHDMGLSKKR